MLGDLDKVAAVDTVQPNFADRGIVADIFLQDNPAMVIDGEVIEHLLAFAALQKDFDLAAVFGVLDIVKTQAPQSAVIVKGGGRDEIIIVGVTLARIPSAVFDPLQTEDVFSKGLCVKLGP